MQVHAVLDSERATDSTGRKLPWAYEFADHPLSIVSPDQAKRRIPEEKGPFGKARKRGTSRSKTATPARKEDQAKTENLKYMDDVFGGRSRPSALQESLRERKSIVPSASLPISASAPNLIDSGGLATSFASTVSSNNAFKEPTEVILYGFGSEAQWAAIDFYEKASSGVIYEDYDRQPPNARYNLSISQQKETSIRSLSRASLQKIRSYVGGEHWIKVTFDSAEAAERACHYSPHPVQGFTVFAERYRGTGPTSDRAIPAVAGSRSVSQAASPQSSTTVAFGTSSTTLSSNTATGSVPASRASIPRSASQPVVSLSGAGAFPTTEEEDEEGERTLLAHQQQASQQAAQLAARTTSSKLQQSSGHTTLRLKAKPGILQPQEKAFLPAASRWQQTFGSWPIIGWVIGTKNGFIGDQVPRREDGSFDAQNASLYWRTWYAVDSCFGTDFCGVKEVEYDE